MLLIAFFEFIVILLFQKNDLFKTVSTFSLWLFILTSGIGYAYIQCVYFLSIHSIGPLKTSFFMAFSPAFTYFFSLILLKEKFDFFVLIGFIAVSYTHLQFEQLFSIIVINQMLGQNLKLFKNRILWYNVFKLRKEYFYGN